MDEQNQLSNLRCFDKLTTKYCEQRRGIRRSFHENIQKRKDFMFNFFDNQPYYKELMPTIIKNNRGIQFYKKIVKKGLTGKSEFFKIIMKTIEQLKKKSLAKYKEKSKAKKYYRIPKIDLLKKKKEKIENYLNKKIQKDKDKEKDNYKPLKRNNTMLDLLDIKRKTSESIMKSTINNSTINNFNKTINNINNNMNNTNTISIDTLHTNNKNESMKNLKSHYSLKHLTKKIPKINFTKNKTIITDKNFKNYFFNSNEKSLCLQNRKLDNILNKCNQSLNFAKNMEENAEKNNDNSKSSENFAQKLKNVLKNRDQRVIEDKGIGNKKYQKLEKEKYDDLKRNMDIKISDDYAYVSRRQLYDLIRDNENILAYQIYLRDMNKFNKMLLKNKEAEIKNITLVENLLEDTYRKKEFLKYKADNYYVKNAKQDELNMFSLQNKDDFFDIKNDDKKKTIGTLLPKLIEIRKYCFGRENYNPIADLENN